MFNPRISKTNWMGVLLSAALVASYGANAKPARESPSSDERQHVPVPLPGAPGEGMIIQKNVMIRMRDGVHLATDIYRPAAHEKFPVVLIRTPFGKQVPDYK